MKHLGALLTFTVLIAPAWDAGQGLAAKDKKAKPPSAAKRVRDVYKNFMKSKSYAVTVSIEGGISASADHSLKQVTVREQYSGDVFARDYMHVPAGSSHPRAFRKAKGSNASGAVFTGLGWQEIRADRQGVRLHRLFNFPQKLFARAYKNVKTARWLPAPASSDIESGQVDLEIDLDDDEDGDHEDGDDEDGDDEDGDDEKADAEDEKKRGTYVKGKDEEVDESQYRLLRIETPAKEALTHFLEVEKSGCMSAG